MKYSYTKIGENIRNLRKKQKIKTSNGEKNMSQDDLIEELGKRGVKIGRNTLSNIENSGANVANLDLLFALCDIFDCDISFLVGEYDDCKTYDNQFIHNQTGLSDKSIQKFKEWLNIKNDFSLMELINKFIQSYEFEDFLEDVERYYLLDGKNFNLNEKIKEKILYDMKEATAYLEKNGDDPLLANYVSMKSELSNHDMADFFLQRAQNSILYAIKHL